MKRYLPLILSVIAALPSFALGLQESVFQFVGDSTLRTASVGVSVVRISDGEEIAGYNSGIAHIPASTMKSLTSASALAILGDDFTFDTEVRLVGKIKKNRFRGTILVEGSGDPTLSSKHIEGQPDFVLGIVRELHRRGITDVKGNIAVIPDESTVMSIVPSWMCEDTPWNYGCGVYPFNFKDNNVEFTLNLSDGDITLSDIIPENVNLLVDNHCTTVSKDKAYSMQFPVLMRYPEDECIHFYGYVEPGDRSRSYQCSMPSPQMCFVSTLTKAMAEAGIKYECDEEEAMKHSEDTTCLLTHSSPRLTTIVKSLLERSDNMYTESVLRAIGYQACGEFSYSQGIMEVYRFWSEAGLDTSELFMKDGSGLARNNKVSAIFLSKMLAEAQTGAIGDINYAALFPRLGKDGTVKNLIKDSPYAGMIAMKSGSMGDVQCFTGYYPVDSPRYAITLLVNNYSCSRRELLNSMERLLLNILPNLD